jgi:cell division FtsZ-interacting protein ZapD
VKNQLKDKLIKEIEGFRTRPASYKELLKVDKKSIDEIVKKVKAQLHYD